MSRRLRLSAGASTVGVLTYLWLGWVRAYDVRTDDDARVVQVVVVGMATIGLAGGLVMCSWWALVAVPVALLGAAELWEVVNCADCPPGENVVILTLVYYGGPAGLGAAAGTLFSMGALLVARRVLRRARPSRPRR